MYFANFIPIKPHCISRFQKLKNFSSIIVHYPHFNFLGQKTAHTVIILTYYPFCPIIYNLRYITTNSFFVKHDRESRVLGWVHRHHRHYHPAANHHFNRAHDLYRARILSYLIPTVHKTDNKIHRT